MHLLGGRVAEKLTLDDISTGASNDIMRATELARDMVTKYGFSEKLVLSAMDRQTKYSSVTTIIHARITQRKLRPR